MEKERRWEVEGEVRVFGVLMTDTVLHARMAFVGNHVRIQLRPLKDSEAR